MPHYQPKYTTRAILTIYPWLLNLASENTGSLVELELQVNNSFIYFFILHKSIPDFARAVLTLKKLFVVFP